MQGLEELDEVSLMGPLEYQECQSAGYKTQRYDAIEDQLRNVEKAVRGEKVVRGSAPHVSQRYYSHVSRATPWDLAVMCLALTDWLHVHLVLLLA